MTVPNLDAMSVDELRDFRHKYRKADLATAQNLVGHIKAPVSAAKELARYADMKASAMLYRKNGHIQVAVRLEESCEAIYKALPPEARW